VQAELKPPSQALSVDGVAVCPQTGHVGAREGEGRNGHTTSPEPHGPHYPTPCRQQRPGAAVPCTERAAFPG